MDMLDILVEDPRWAAVDLEALSLKVLQAACADLDLPPDAVELTLLACDDARIATLNTAFRGKATPTNVLSWPAEERAATKVGARPLPPQPDPDGTLALGDIAISYDTCAAEATAAGRDFADHVTHLILHGTLHLLGYDHIDDQDAALMEGLEVKILGKLGVDDPYRDIQAQ